MRFLPAFLFHHRFAVVPLPPGGRYLLRRTKNRTPNTFSRGEGGTA